MNKARRILKYFRTFAHKMKRTVVFLLLLATLSAFSQPKHEVRAVWLTVLGNLDWPTGSTLDGEDATAQQQELVNILDRLKAININTVLLHTRIRANTIYPSNIEPWAPYLSGRPGRDPGYDALQFAIDECHKRGMELHAWVVTIPIGKWKSHGCQQLRQRYPPLVKHMRRGLPESRGQSHGRLPDGHLRGNYAPLRHRRHPSGLYPLPRNLEGPQESRQHYTHRQKHSRQGKVLQAVGEAKLFAHR